MAFNITINYSVGLGIHLSAGKKDAETFDHLQSFMSCAILFSRLCKTRGKQLKSVNKRASHNWKRDHKEMHFSRSISTHESCCVACF